MERQATATPKFLRARDVNRRRNTSNSTTYRYVNLGLLPPPVRLGPGRTAFVTSELDRVDAAVIAGATDDEIRTLVRDIVAKRKQATS